jgi:uncharacterized protein
VLVATMSAARRPGEFVFVAGSVPAADVLASVVEPEGLSVVTTRSAADRAGLGYDLVLGWITLQVHSALDAVGLTAAVSTALTEAGISCNVIAGYHHDHLLVPVDRTDDALVALQALSAGAARR